jgi:hypothetical protein
VPHPVEPEEIRPDSPFLQQFMAPLETPLAASGVEQGFTAEVLTQLGTQISHGSLGLDSFESSHVSDVCLHKAIEIGGVCPLSTPERKRTVVAAIAKTAAIIIKYSKEPCARDMIRDRDEGYKKLSRAVHQVVPFMYNLSAAHFSFEREGLCQL